MIEKINRNKGLIVKGINDLVTMNENANLL